ncbi:MAG: TGS domain-containing protein, partial [Bacteriovoracaceae bacterium]
YSPRIKKFLSNTLTQEKIKFKLDGRTKHLYSTYKKLKKYDGDINKIYDVVAFRIIVSSIPDCYRVLGIVHSNFKPLIGKIKDYIAVPKPNGYRSLHTTVFGLDGVITEIQIRTEKMHEEAENGLASHWKYSEKKAEVFERGAKVQASDREQKVINELKEAIKFDGLTPNVALDLFPDKIFVFSPKGDIYELREGSTPIDFAYAIHSSIAEKCIGCKVNEKIVPLDTKLENCDIVEVITAKNSFGPSRDWLFFVATAGAKQKIRAFLRRQDKEKNIQTGIEVLTEELRFFNKEFDEVKKKDWEEVLSSLPQKTLESLLSAIGNGDVSGSQIAKKICSKDKIKIVKKKKKGRPRKIPGIEGTEGVKIFFPSCCEPRSSDRIIGFITKGSGIAIHKEDCKNIEREDIQRLIEVKWEKFPTKDIKFIIKARDRKGLLKEIISVITSLDVFIKEMKTTTKSRGISAITFKAELDSGYKRKILKMRLLEVTDILSVETVG